MTDLDRYLPAIRARDQAAFAAWLAQAEPALRRQLGSFAAQVDVEAVLQEALLRIWVLAPRHRPDGGPNSLLRLAARIGRNLALDEVRRQRRSTALDDPDGLPDPRPAPPPDPMLARIIEQCLEELGERARAALRARLEAGGERDEELAARVQMTPPAFRQNVARARRAMAHCLKERGVPLEEILG